MVIIIGLNNDLVFIELLTSAMRVELMMHAAVHGKSQILRRLKAHDLAKVRV